MTQTATATQDYSDLGFVPKKKSSSHTEDEFQSARGEAAKTYPRLASYLDKVKVQRGETKPDDPRQLEFYPPWESENPNPGTITLEIFNPKLKGKYLRDAIAGDTLHYLGAIDPQTKKPIDPEYYALKQRVLKARTPHQEALDRRIYEQEKQQHGGTRSYEDWLQQSRIDHYIGGYIVPDERDEWRQHGFYKEPAMKSAVEDIHKYLTETPDKLPKHGEKTSDNYAELGFTPKSATKHSSPFTQREKSEQDKRSPFSLETGLPMKDPAAVTEYVVGEIGGGLWDAAKGVFSLAKPPETTAEKVAFTAGGPAAVIGKRILESFYGSFSKSSEVPAAIKDLMNNPDHLGLAALAYVIPRALGQWEGMKLTGKALEKAPAAVEKVVDVAKKVKESGSLQPAVQSAMGTGTDAAAKVGTEARVQYQEAVEKTRKYNLEKAEEHSQAKQEVRANQANENIKAAAAQAEEDAKVKQANEEAQKDYQAEKVEVEEINKDIEAKNKSKEDAVQRRGTLGQKIVKDSGELQKDVKKLEGKARAQKAEAYKVVDEKVENAGRPAETVADFVTYAIDNILQGSKESIAQFNSILSRADEVEEGELAKTLGTEQIKRSLADLQDDPDREVSFHDLQGYSTELGFKINGTTEILGDVRRALKFVKDGLDGIKYEIAEEHGAADDLSHADSLNAKWMQTFHNMRAVDYRGGSPLARVLRATGERPTWRQFVETPEAREMGTAGQRAVSMLDAYADLGGDKVAAKARQLVNDFTEHDGLPKKLPESHPKPTKPLPEEPKPAEAKKIEAKEVKQPGYPDYKELPEPPSVQAMTDLLTKAKRTGSEAYRKRLRNMDLLATGWLIRSEIFSFSLKGPLIYGVFRFSLGKLLKSPAAIRYITEVTPEDIQVMKDAYEADPVSGAKAQENVTGLLEEAAKNGQKVSISRWEKFLTGAQLGRVIRAYSKAVAAKKAAEQTPVGVSQ